jgi:hypothetical protein
VVFSGTRLLGTCKVYAVVIYGFFVLTYTIKGVDNFIFAFMVLFQCKIFCSICPRCFSIASLFFKNSEKYHLRGITSILQFILFLVLMIAVANYEVISQV